MSRNFRNCNTYTMCYSNMVPYTNYVNRQGGVVKFLRWAILYSEHLAKRKGNIEGEPLNYVNTRSLSMTLMLFLAWYISCQINIDTFYRILPLSIPSDHTGQKLIPFFHKSLMVKFHYFFCGSLATWP